MTMDDIWLTGEAEDAFRRLAPVQADAVSRAIDDIASRPGRQIDLPGAPLAEPFLAKEPTDPEAPVVIYRRTTPREEGGWLVVSLMNREDYRAARMADQKLAVSPANVRNFVNAVVGTVAAVNVNAPPGIPGVSRSSGGVPARDPDTSGPDGP